jgi:hypothetical protein
MSQTFASVPAEIRTKSGAAHATKLMSVVEIMRQEHGRDIDAYPIGTNFRNFAVNLSASQKNFHGEGGADALRDIFKAAVKTYAERKKKV